jgi:hypothetical protein
MPSTAPIFDSVWYVFILDWDGNAALEMETLRQFELDAPRTAIFVDNQLWTKSPDALFEVFCIRFPRLNALIAAEFCTQTALAPYFISVFQRLEHLEVHFIDGGQQTITLLDAALQVEKPFKVMELDSESNESVLFFVILKVQVDLMSGETVHEFLLRESDWVNMAEDNDAQELREVNTTTIDDIADRVRTARRWRG